MSINQWGFIMWNVVTKAKPPVDLLLIVYQDMTGVCLRKLTSDGDWYDENEVFDDSELEITHWQYTPDPPTSDD